MSQYNINWIRQRLADLHPEEPAPRWGPMDGLSERDLWRLLEDRPEFAEVYCVMRSAYDPAHDYGMLPDDADHMYMELCHLLDSGPVEVLEEFVDLVAMYPALDHKELINAYFDGREAL
jgi:hypothetical protein